MLVNVGQSELIPVLKVTFLGECLELWEARAYISPEIKQAIAEIISTARLKGLRFPVAETARVVGIGFSIGKDPSEGPAASGNHCNPK